MLTLEEREEEESVSEPATARDGGMRRRCQEANVTVSTTPRDRCPHVHELITVFAAVTVCVALSLHPRVILHLRHNRAPQQWIADQGLHLPGLTEERR